MEEKETKEEEREKIRNKNTKEVRRKICNKETKDGRKGNIREERNTKGGE
jgi:hypothetical protein